MFSYFWGILKTSHRKKNKFAAYLFQYLVTLDEGITNLEKSSFCQTIYYLGSGKADGGVASYTRGYGFESSHWQLLFEQLNY